MYKIAFAAALMSAVNAWNFGSDNMMKGFGSGGDGNFGSFATDFVKNARNIGGSAGKSLGGGFGGLSGFGGLGGLSGFDGLGTAKSLDDMGANIGKSFGVSKNL